MVSLLEAAIVPPFARSRAVAGRRVRFERPPREADFERLQQPPFQRRVALAAGDEVGHHRADRGALASARASSGR